MNAISILVKKLQSFKEGSLTEISEIESNELVNRKKYKVNR